MKLNGLIEFVADLNQYTIPNEQFIELSIISLL